MHLLDEHEQNPEIHLNISQNTNDRFRKSNIKSLNRKFNTKTIKLKIIQESNLKNEVFRTIYKKQNLIKEGNLFKEKSAQNVFESTTLVTNCRGHDGPSWSSVAPYLYLFLLLFFINSLLPSTDRSDGPLQA